MMGRNVWKWVFTFVCWLGTTQLVGLLVGAAFNVLGLPHAGAWVMISLYITLMVMYFAVPSTHIFLAWPSKLFERLFPVKSGK